MLCRVSLIVFVFSVYHYPGDWGVVELAFSVQNFGFFTVFDSCYSIGQPHHHLKRVCTGEYRRCKPLMFREALFSLSILSDFASRLKGPSGP